MVRRPCLAPQIRGWPMWVVFGLTEFSRPHGQETRFCARCADIRSHERKASRGWFSLFFVPVTPITPLFFSAQCTGCGLSQSVKPQRWWTLEPRRAAKVRWGRFWIVVAAVLGAIMVLGGVGSRFDPKVKDPPPLWALPLMVLVMAGPPAAVSAWLLRSARRLAEDAAQGRDTPDPDVEAIVQLRTKACPTCHERLPVAAQRCGHCATAFDPASVKAATGRAKHAIDQLLERLGMQAQLDHQRRVKTALSILGWFLVATLLFAIPCGVLVLYFAHRAGKKAEVLSARLNPVGAGIVGQAGSARGA